jgi:rhodanese-related sulfurtransferase
MTPEDDAANDITPVAAAAMLRQGGLVLVDVREDDERAEAHIPGSLHVPLGQLDQRVDELPAQRPLAFICAGGRRSAAAAAQARTRGLDARSVEGGMTAWEQAGLPARRGGAR